MYLPQWVTGTLALLSGSSKVSIWPSAEHVNFISKDGSDHRYLTAPDAKDGGVPVLYDSLQPKLTQAPSSRATTPPLTASGCSRQS